MDKPLFGAAGQPAVLFNVGEDVSVDDALNFASCFLATAASLGNTSEPLDDDGRWAIVHLAEMAKALVDTVNSRTKAPRCPVQAEGEVCHD